MTKDFPDKEKIRYRTQGTRAAYKSTSNYSMIEAARYIGHGMGIEDNILAHK